VSSQDRDGIYPRVWPEKAPVDGIVVTASAPRVLPSLVEQLKPGGGCDPGRRASTSSL